MKKHLLSLLGLVALSTATLAQVPSYVPTNGLVGYWPFNGDAVDATGLNPTGTLNGNMQSASDRFGNPNAAFEFDGVNDFILVGTPNQFRFADDAEICVNVWLMSIDLPATGDVQTVYENYGCPYDGFANQNGQVFRLNIVGQDTVLGRVRSGSGTVGNNLAASVYGNSSSNSWLMMTMQKNLSTGNIELYINGTLVDSHAYTSGQQGNNGDFPFRIGARYQCVSGNAHYNTSFYDGMMDDFAIWNRALAPCEIGQLFSGSISNPTASISANGSTTFCSGGSVTLTASAGSSYLWSNGATSQSITVSQGGNYAVTVTDANGCQATSAVTTATVSQTPSSGVTVGGATTFCTGGSVTLTAQGTGSYLWSNGATSQSITVNQTGNYSVTVTNNGCSATSGSTTVTVNQTPTASITPQGSTIFCQGGFVVLQAAGGGTYQWNTGAQSSSINVSQSGTYTVQVSQNGCTANAQQQVTVNPLPSVSLQPIAALCANASAVALTGGSPAGGSYTVNGTPATSFDPSQTGSGTQTVAYTYTDGNGCSNTATRSVTVNAVPSVSLSGLNTAYLPTDAPVQLNGSPTGGVFNGTGVSNGQFDPAAAGLGTHSVQYVVVGANGCVGSSGLCTTVDLTTGSGIGLDNGGSNGVEVYPNPSNGLFTVVMDGLDGIVQLSVMDIRGREVASQSLTARGRTNHNIDLSGFSSGVYTLRIQSAAGVSGVKLVKE